MSETSETKNHVHDCTGPSGRCPCGWKLTVSRFQVSIEVYDNRTKRELVNECFGCDDIDGAIGALEEAAENLERDVFAGEVE